MDLKTLGTGWLDSACGKHERAAVTIFARCAARSPLLRQVADTTHSTCSASRAEANDRSTNAVTTGEMNASSQANKRKVCSGGG